MYERLHRTQHGFSLIEVVVALAILALTLGTVLRLVSGTMLSTGKAENYLRALSVAQSQLADAAARPQLNLGTSQGVADGIDWRLSVLPFTAPRPSPGTSLYHVVALADYRGSKVELETLLIARSPP